jgi:spore germination protein YaaH
MDPTPDAPRRAPVTGKSVKRLVVLGAVVIVALTAFVGFALTRTPEPWKRSGPPITVSAWAPYWQPDAAFASFSANAGVFSDLSLFAYHATAVDSVTPYDGFDPNVKLLYGERAAATDPSVAITASIIDDTAPGAMAAILADPASRSLHVQTIAKFADDGGFAGIDLDYEKFAFHDGRDTWAATRPNWIAFVTELANALHATGKTLTVSVPPVYDGGQTADSGYWVYDYEAMGKVVDRIRMMAYDYNTSEPGPIAPIDWVTKLVAAAKKLVAADKLVLGVPVYGYDWPAEVTGACPVGVEPKRGNLSTKTAAELAGSKGIAPTWVESAAERTFTYGEQHVGNDAAGNPTSCIVKHSVWYADAEAVHDRAWVAERQDLAGISLWSLGSDDPLVWEGIDAARQDIATWPPTTNTAVTNVQTTALPVQPLSP